VNRLITFHETYPSSVITIDFMGNVIVANLTSNQKTHKLNISEDIKVIFIIQCSCKIITVVLKICYGVFRVKVDYCLNLIFSLKIYIIVFNSNYDVIIA